MGVEKREMEIVIAPDGQVRVTVRGVKGSKCLDLTKFLEEVLGDVQDRRYTSEYYEREEETRTYTGR